MEAEAAREAAREAERAVEEAEAAELSEKQIAANRAKLAQSGRPRKAKKEAAEEQVR